MHRFALKLNDVRFVDNAVKNRVRYRWVSEQVVPLLLWILAGDEQRAVLGLLIDDIEEEGTELYIDPADSKVINDQKFCSDELPAEFWEHVVRVRQGYLLEQLRCRAINRV